MGLMYLMACNGCGQRSDVAVDNDAVKVAGWHLFEARGLQARKPALVALCPACGDREPWKALLAAVPDR